MAPTKTAVSSGVADLDRLLGGGVFIGDNVVWYDDAGSLAPPFCLEFIRHSLAENKALVYVNIDRSLRNLLESLGPLSESPSLTIVDGFTHGKGEGAKIFLEFTDTLPPSMRSRVVQLSNPRDAETLSETLYQLHQERTGDVRFVFDSLTGMQALWGSEEMILQFYSRACPRLYELNTIAYWLIEKGAHSARLRANLNRITQVAIELAVRRGKSSLTVLKAAMHDTERLNVPQPYWSREQRIRIDADSRTPGGIDLGSRIRTLRTRQGLSQTELARSVGVTPSTISQVEHNQIYPSLPALYKMSETLGVEVGALFGRGDRSRPPVVFAASQAVAAALPAGWPRDSVVIERLMPSDVEAAAEPFRLEIAAGAKLGGHFFQHKGEEVGHVEAGELILRMADGTQTARVGDTIYLKSEAPAGWENPGPDAARLFWLKLP